MEIIIAGFNIDTNFISQSKGIATPETISAAYARISRSSKTVNKLREISQKEVQKARISNQKIIFEMGHSSIAEHAVFNIDIIGVSRFMTEFIQKSRLASFTEKSQRYVTLQGDYVMPEEIKNTELEKRFIRLIEKQNDFYEKVFRLGKDYLKEKSFPGTKSELEGKAKEDARYCLALATQTQMGMTINARSLARLLKRLDKVDLVEAKCLKESIEQKVKEITPSLLRYTCADDFEKNHLSMEKSFFPTFKMLSFTKNADDIILAGMLFEKSGKDFDELIQELGKMESAEKEKMYQRIFANIKPYHSVPRSFELVNALFQIPMSASCYAQWKRHRLESKLSSSKRICSAGIVPLLQFGRAI